MGYFAECFSLFSTGCVREFLVCSASGWPAVPWRSPPTDRHNRWKLLSKRSSRSRVTTKGQSMGLSVPRPVGPYATTSTTIISPPPAPSIQLSSPAWDWLLLLSATVRHLTIPAIPPTTPVQLITPRRFITRHHRLPSASDGAEAGRGIGEVAAEAMAGIGAIMADTVVGVAEPCFLSV